jgi:hypothetical protein
LLRQIFEVDPLVCPRCTGPMRIVACITQAAVIDQILTHLRTRPYTPRTNGKAKRFIQTALREWAYARA